MPDIDFADLMDGEVAEVFLASHFTTLWDTDGGKISLEMRCKRTDSNSF